MAPPDMAPPRWPGGALLACRAHPVGSGRAHRRRPHGPPVIYRHTRGSARRSCRPRVHGHRTGTVPPRAPAARQPHVRTWLHRQVAGRRRVVGLRARSLARRTLGSARLGTHALGRFGPRVCPLAPPPHPPLLAPAGGPRACGHDSAGGPRACGHDSAGGPRACGHDSAGGGPCQPSAAACPTRPPARPARSVAVQRLGALGQPVQHTARPLVLPAEGQADQLAGQDMRRIAALLEHQVVDAGC